MRCSDRGAATIAFFLLALIAAVVLLGLGSLTMLYGARTAANTAADAAALAAAVATFPPAGGGDPHEEATLLAEVNGAVLISCDCPVNPSMSVREATVIVEMKVSVPVFGELGVRAAARAEFDPVAWLGVG